MYSGYTLGDVTIPADFIFANNYFNIIILDFSMNEHLLIINKIISNTHYQFQNTLRDEKYFQKFNFTIFGYCYAVSFQQERLCDTEMCKQVQQTQRRDTK